MVKEFLRGLTVFTAGAAALVVAAPGHAAPGQAVAVRPAGGTVALVSVSSVGRLTNGDSFVSGISAHGRFVAFDSWGSNLVPGDRNDTVDVFVRDRLTGVTTWESVSSRGAEGNADSWGELSADGRVVAFMSNASNLVPGDTNGIPDVFVRDRVTGVTERVSVATNGRQANGSGADVWAISADGRYVAFYSDASNLVRGDTGGHSDVFVRDRVRRVTERVSVATNGRQGNGNSVFPSISSDGRYVAFESEASNLVRGDTNRAGDVFVRDRLKKVTARVSLTSIGLQFWMVSHSLSISGNGRYMAFQEIYPKPDGRDVLGALFVRDRLRGVTRRVPASSPSEVLGGASFSQDGRYVAYKGSGENAYIWDQRRNVIRRLPTAVDTGLILSADGRHGAFGGALHEIGVVYAWDDVSDALVPRRFR